MNKIKKLKFLQIISVAFVLFSSVNIFAQNGDLITATSVGDIKLGMTIGEARKVLPESYRFDEAGGSEGVVFLGIFDGKTLLMEIGMYYDGRETDEKPPIDENQKITDITIHDSRYKTVEGVYVGMPIAEAEKSFGKLKEVKSEPHIGQTAKFTNQPEYLNFLVDRKNNVDISVASYEKISNCEITDASDCLQLKYAPDSYISEMRVSSPRPVQQSTSIINTPNNYKVTIYGPSDCDRGNEGSKTTYYISWEVPLKNGGYSLPHQQFSFEGLMPCPELGYGEDNTTVSYKDQWDVVLDDFNFDGLTDLALRDGNDGGYGFPSYQVYLFSKAENKFVLSPSFTELGQYQGMFEVKADRKMIYNHTKSGCCSHTTEGYTVVNNKPFKVYDHTVEGFIEVSDGVTTPEVITKKLINGKWRTWNINSASRISFDKGKSSKTFTVRLTENEPIKWFKLGAAEGQILNVSTNTADADVKLVDFRGKVSFYDSSEAVNGGVEFPVKLKANGDYYLEISAEKNLNVSLTISIK